MQKFRGFKCINILPYAVNTTELGRVTEFIEEESLIEYNLELHGETNLIPIYSIYFFENGQRCRCSLPPYRFNRGDFVLLRESFDMNQLTHRNKIDSFYEAGLL
ncbi:hypothetical protein CWI38_0056p0040 [Hamiltosporidium tvaerminnensis]|uniref:Uncharacterized protein n=1 Tax=Hamiltosporidium tvaerminnensis TaxID=1176355 RepID=A0A4Q9M4P2_9MICR|nr:hypothetical protein CWI38_0056p0040 [Hamiltosporidium tvaerminnensis]